jgi:hypothetical protein
MDQNLKEKMHRYLDGETPQAEFTSEETREIAAQEEIIAETRKLYQSIEVPDLTARITARLAANASASSAVTRLSQSSSHPLRRSVAWLWTPHPVRLRPAYGIVAVMALVLLTVILHNGAPLQETAPSSEAAAKIFVQFRLDAPQASDVHLVGSFTEWKPTYTLHETAPGIWSVLVPLDPGVHDYAFLVNGKWITDPLAPIVDDGFGGSNSRLLVLLPDSRSRL